MPLLFTLLNEMEGLDEDADVVFLLARRGNGWPSSTCVGSRSTTRAWTRCSTGPTG